MIDETRDSARLQRVRKHGSPKSQCPSSLRSTQELLRHCNELLECQPCMPREVPVPELRVHPQHSSVSTVVVHFIHDRVAARDTWYPTAAGFAPHARQSVYVLVLVSGPGRTLSSSDAASGIRDAGRSKTRRSGFYYSMWKMKVTWSCTSYNPLLAPFDLSPCLRVLQHAIVGHQPFDLRISFEFSARLNLEDNLCLLLRTIT